MVYSCIPGSVDQKEYHNEHVLRLLKRMWYAHRCNTTALKDPRFKKVQIIGTNISQSELFAEPPHTAALVVDFFMTTWELFIPF